MLDVLDFLHRPGIAGAVLLGTTGEFVHFDLDDRAKLASLAVRRARFPLIVNVSHSTLDGAWMLARSAAEAGAAGLILMPPYFPRFPREAIRGFFRQFVEGLDEPLPVFLYNIPQVTSPLDTRTAIDLLETGLFAGIKDSSGDWDAFARLLDASRRLGFRLFSGSERIFARGRLAGSHGIISGAASAIPELVLALDAAIAASNQPRIDLLHARLVQFIDSIEVFPPNFAIKEAAALRGLNAGPTAFPLSGVLGERMRSFRAWFPQWWAETSALLAAK